MALLLIILCRFLQILVIRRHQAEAGTHGEGGSLGIEVSGGGWRRKGGQPIHLGDESPGLCINSNRVGGEWEGSRTAALHRHQGVSNGASAEMK